MLKLLRLWVVLVLAYASTKFVVNLALFGWIDVRQAAVWELASIPAVQAVVLQLISDRRRRTDGPRA